MKDTGLNVRYNAGILYNYKANFFEQNGPMVVQLVSPWCCFFSFYQVSPGYFYSCLRHWPSRGDIVISRTKTGNLRAKFPSARMHVCFDKPLYVRACTYAWLQMKQTETRSEPLQNDRD